jgi:carboxylesterase
MRHSMMCWVLAIALVATSGCALRTAYGEDDLDGGKHPIPSVLLSRTRPHPTEAERDRPVLIATHGFSSTSWEIGPLAEAMNQRGIQVSAVTLGAHGTSLEDFRRSDWRTWGAPLIAEYRALRAQGYRHIAVMGHSTGGTLWLRALADGALGTVPDRMVFVAPLIEFAAPTRGIYLSGILPVFGIQDFARPLRGDSKGRLYKIRPVSALQSLTELTTGVRRRLERGLALPATSRVLIVQGDRDDVVDPAGARLLVSGLVGPQTRLMMVGSWMHNPVGPDGIQGHRFTEAEAALRERLLGAIGDHLAGPAR